MNGFREIERAADDPSRARARAVRTQPLVLAIDDDPAVRRLVRATLRDRGMQVEMTSDGPAGLLTAVQTQPDVIIVDSEMPRWDGRRTLERLRAEPSLAAVPIIMAAPADPATWADLLLGGADGIVAKPLLPRDLCARVAAAVRSSEQRRRRNGPPAIDTLTGLPDRGAAAVYLDGAIARAAGEGHGCAVIRAGIDGLFDPRPGDDDRPTDRALRSVAAAMHERLRSGSFLARHDRDEFLIVLLDPEPDTVGGVAGRLHDAVAAAVPSLAPMTSIGAALWSPGLTAADLLEGAGRARRAATTARRPPRRL